MKRTYQSVSIALFGLLMLASCSKQKSMQEYYVENQENENFIAIDLPASLVDLGEDASPETRETLATVKKLNILAFKINETNESEYEVKYNEAKDILKGDRYNELMRLNHEGVNIRINYLGDDETVDEFIVLASEKTKGFALARVLGDKMEPAKIMKMAEDIKSMDTDGAAFDELSQIFEGIDLD